MGERRVNISELARELELNRNTITLLYNDTAKRIEIETLEKLCVYFNCTPSDLFEVIKDS